jgi:hypothetical protein
MIHLNRDPSGDQARLECDQCCRASNLMLAGPPIDALAAGVVRDWLRMHRGKQGWSPIPSIQEGVTALLDLCPRCAPEKRE